MDDVFRFAKLEKRPLGEYEIGRSCQTRVRPAVADEDGHQSPPGVDVPGNRTLADAAPDLAIHVCVRERDVQTAVPKPESIRINCHGNVELPEGVPDGIVEPVTDDRELGGGAHVVYGVEERGVDRDVVEKLVERSAVPAGEGDLSLHAFMGVDPAADPLLLDAPPL